MDQHAYGDILSKRKDAIVLGTYDTSAFILSLRDQDEFSKIHSSGYHCIPHIGTYGQDYTLTLPMMLLSLPATPSYLKKLPTDVLNALDLEHINTSHSTNAVQVGIARRDPHNNEHQSAHPYQIHAVALELVRNALQSACRRLAINGERCDGYIGFNQQDPKVESKCLGRGVVVESDWTMTKRESSVSMESEGYVSCSSGFNTSRNMSFQDQSVEAVDKEIQKEVRIVAKKLVNKVLHLACKNVESLYRRSSIEYLIASTKRMKITESPSPPPTLFNIVEEQGDEQPVSHYYQTLRSKSERSPTPEAPKTRRVGSKRQRSGSHDVAMMDDREQRKQISLVSQLFDGRVTKEVTRRHTQRKSEEPTPNFLSTRDNDSVGELTATINRLSLVIDSESETEDNYTVLSAVTKPASRGFSKASYKHEQARQVGQLAIQETENKLLPNETLQTSNESSFVYKSSKMTDIPSIVVNDISNDVILETDLFVIIHSYPPPSLCQKILCSNQDEINLVYHCWLYKDSPFDPSVTLSSKVEVGVFDPHLVQPVHLDLQDGGAPFYFLEERTVCIHNCCFSPENVQLQVLSPPLPLGHDEDSFHHFVSAARHGSRRVVTLHFIPSSSSVEETLRESIHACSCLDQLLTALRKAFPIVGEKITYFVLPY